MRGCRCVRRADTVAGLMAASRTGTSSGAGAKGRPLSASTRALCAFAAAMARQDDRLAGAALASARASGTRRRAAEESALMLMLYAGYPCALEGLRVLHGAWPGSPRASDSGTAAAHRRRGEDLR